MHSVWFAFCMASRKKAPGGLKPGDVASLFKSLQSTARNLARGDSTLADDLVATAWVRIVECRKKPYKVAQFHVVGVNAMRRALRAEIEHRTGCTPSRRGNCRVPLIDEVVVVDADTVATRDQVMLVLMSASATARTIFEQFLRCPDTLTAAARRVGLSAATACRAAAEIRQLLPGCGLSR